MSTLQNSRSADEIETELNETNRKMLELQEKGDYVEAEECRQRSEKLKQQF